MTKASEATETIGTREFPAIHQTWPVHGRGLGIHSRPELTEHLAERRQYEKDAAQEAADAAKAEADAAAERADAAEKADAEAVKARESRATGDVKVTRRQAGKDPLVSE